MFLPTHPPFLLRPLAAGVLKDAPPLRVDAHLAFFRNHLAASARKTRRPACGQIALCRSLHERRAAFLAHPPFLLRPLAAGVLKDAPPSPRGVPPPCGIRCADKGVFSLWEVLACGGRPPTPPMFLSAHPTFVHGSASRFWGETPQTPLPFARPPTLLVRFLGYRSRLKTRRPHLSLALPPFFRNHLAASARRTQRSACGQIALWRSLHKRRAAFLAHPPFPLCPCAPSCRRARRSRNG